jgi:hypothetical protein
MARGIGSCGVSISSITRDIIMIVIPFHFLTCLSSPDPVLQLIKRRIESLIDREYLQRDADNQNTYKYMA